MNFQCFKSWYFILITLQINLSIHYIGYFRLEIPPNWHNRRMQFHIILLYNFTLHLRSLLHQFKLFLIDIIILF
jgi:hypothetical protein